MKSKIASLESSIAALRIQLLEAQSETDARVQQSEFKCSELSTRCDQLALRSFEAELQLKASETKRQELEKSLALVDARATSTMSPSNDGQSDYKGQIDKQSKQIELLTSQRDRLSQELQSIRDSVAENEVRFALL